MVRLINFDFSYVLFTRIVMLFSPTFYAVVNFTVITEHQFIVLIIDQRLRTVPIDTIEMVVPLNSQLNTKLHILFFQLWTHVEYTLLGYVKITPRYCTFDGKVLILNFVLNVVSETVKVVPVITVYFVRLFFPILADHTELVLYFLLFRQICQDLNFVLMSDFGLNLLSLPALFLNLVQKRCLFFKEGFEIIIICLLEHFKNVCFEVHYFIKRFKNYFRLLVLIN